MTFRMFDPDRDTTAAHRIWQEVGWIEDGNKDAKRGLEFLIGCSRARVAELNGAAECLVTTTPGTIRYLNEDLDFSCVSSVTTSRVARKQGLAGRLTAQAVAEDATNGALVAGLGMFEQGFYNRLGFGTGGYMPILTFDPARLRVPVPNRPPRRVERGDWAAMHTNRLNRQQVHGAWNPFSGGSHTGRDTVRRQKMLRPRFRPNEWRAESPCLAPRSRLGRTRTL